MITGRIGSILWETIETIAIALILTLVVRSFIVESFVVKGGSMRPTLQDGERLLVSKFKYRINEPKRGDIIVFRSPVDPGDDLIKRVIAVPGERVEIVDGEVLVDGSSLDEPYARPNVGNFPPHVVPDGRVFVLGDNRPNSEDSRYFGSVTIGSLKGKAVFIWWPLPLAAVLP